MKEWARKIIPRKILTLIRFYQIYNKVYGHSHFINNFVCDGNNSPLPWITYPCIEFLNRLDLSHCNVFEFGSGSSTLFWSQKSCSVMSVEKDKAWFDKVKTSLPSNCTLHHAKTDIDYIDCINKSESEFDIIIIDGAVRYPCALEALKKISKRGIVILDNTEWYPETAKMLTLEGFSQIDFVGFPPINAFPSATSIFFKSTELINNKLVQHQWAPMGGRYLDAYDDQIFENIDEQFIQK